MTTATVDISHALEVEGYMLEDELSWLGQQAQFRKTIVEIGSYLGRSTCALAANTQGTVYALDDWEGPRDVPDANPNTVFDRYVLNVARYSNIVSMRCDHARPPELPSPDMVFIDGSHKYEDVRRDIAYWKSKLAIGGLLCGHDYNWDGVYEAVQEFCPKAKPVFATAIWYWKAA
jgi:precorrin-6B methylase 2